jgi:hypothetical protein
MPVYFSMYVFNNFMPDDLLRELVFFNTLEELNLPIKGPMEDSGVVKLYEQYRTPCLYVAPAENMVGRAPLMPLFLAGNATPTIAHLYSKRKDSVFRWVALTQQRWTKGGAAMSMRLTCGCDNLGVASHTWVVSQLSLLRRLKKGSKLTGMNGTSVQLKIVGGARRIEPDSK